MWGLLAVTEVLTAEIFPWEILRDPAKWAELSALSEDHGFGISSTLLTTEAYGASFLLKPDGSWVPSFLHAFENSSLGCFFPSYFRGQSAQAEAWHVLRVNVISLPLRVRGKRTLEKARPFTHPLLFTARYSFSPMCNHRQDPCSEDKVTCALLWAGQSFQHPFDAEVWPNTSPLLFAPVLARLTFVKCTCPFWGHPFSHNL